MDIDIVAYGEIETNSNDYLGVFYAKTPIKDRLDFKSSLHIVVFGDARNTRQAYDLQ